MPDPVGGEPKFAGHGIPMRAKEFHRDLVDEGPPQKEFIEGIASRVPGKTIASGALISDREGKLLFVRPTYRPGLGIPGGIVEANESPLAACQREVAEELGLRLTIGDLLIVDWMPQRGVWRDSIEFIFDGGCLTNEQVKQISLPKDELSGICFSTLDNAAGELFPSLYRRIARALEAKKVRAPRYGEFGR